MSSPPPKYPRVPHLASSAAVTGADSVLPSLTSRALIGRSVLVEEKLDGMNVVIWADGGIPHVATRGGAGSVDRSGERGLLKAWASMRSSVLVAALGERYALYGEWLRRRHGIPYRNLPGELIGIDILDRPAANFADIARRDALLASAQIPSPPVIFRGDLTSLRALESLLGPSRYADIPAEGLIIRPLDGAPPRVTKLVNPRWAHIGSVPWRGENAVAV